MRVQRKTKKPIIVTIIVIIAIIIAALLWRFAFAGSGSNHTEDAQSSDQKNESSPTKDTDNPSKTSPDNQSVPHEKEKELPQLYEGENVNESASLTGAITAKSVMAGNLIIRNTIDQMVSGGNCELTLSSGGRTIVRSAEIIQNPSSSTCAGFDIPVSDLAPGQWNIEIKVSNGDKAMTLKDTVNI